MKDLIEMTEAELIDRYEKLGYQEEEVVAEKIEIRNEIGQRLKKSKLDSKMIGDWAVTLYKKVVVKSPDKRTDKVAYEAFMEKMRELGLVKEVTELKIETGKAKMLFKSGVKVPGTIEEEKMRMTKVNQEVK